MSKEAEDYLEAKINNREIHFSFSSEGVPRVESTDIPEVMEAYHQYKLKKIMPSDEDIESYIEKYIEHNGYKMHDLSVHNECLTDQGVADCVFWLKQKLLK